MNILEKHLAERGTLLFDGATGTNLFAAGLEAGEPPELWNIDHPDRIRKLHQDFIDSGSDIILTNSFGGTSFRLKLHNAQDRAYELNKRAAELARECADNAGRPVLVAGSVGPTGELLVPVGPVTHEEAVEAFMEQGRGLMDGGADFLWAETISSEEEMLAVADAAKRLDVPFGGTMSFDTAGRTMMGVTSSGYAELAARMPAKPIAIGANCGTGASDLLRTILGITEADSEIIVVAKGNAGIPKYVEGHIHYDGTPELMADYARLAMDSGAKVIGGCCGSRPVHIAAMRGAIDSHTKGERPSLDEIINRIGPFTSYADGTDPDDTPKRERKSRRRG